MICNEKNSKNKCDWRIGLPIALSDDLEETGVFEPVIAMETLSISTGEGIVQYTFILEVGKEWESGLFTVGKEKKPTSDVKFENSTRLIYLLF